MKKLSAVNIGVVILLLLVVAAPVPAAAPPKTIKLGTSVDLTGPASNAQRYGLKGMQDCVQWFNLERHGVKGRPVELMWADSELKPSLETDQFKRWHGRGALVHICWSGAMAEQLKPEAERLKFPIVYAACTDTQINPPGWSWGIMPPYGDLTAGAIDWIMQKRWNNPTPPTVVVFGNDTAWCRAALTSYPYLKGKYGIKTLPFTVVPWFALDVVPQIMETVSNGGANIIVAQLGPEVGVLIDDLVKLGLRDKVQIVFPYFVQGGSGIATAKPKKGAEGIICGFPQAQPNFLEHGEFPGLDVPINFQKKIRGWAEISPYFYYGGWACVYVALKAAELAAEKVGVENLSGAAIHEALQRIDIKGADTHGVFRIIKGSPTERSLSDSSILTEWDPKKQLFTPVTGWMVMPKMREWLKAHPEAK